jgi:hypothetical protein
MGHGQLPGPADDHGDGTSVDEGTLARTESPPPGPIGLDAKGGGAKGGGPSIADQIVSYVRRRRGDRVGDGECFTLVDRALRSAGAKRARDHGSVTPDADYVWGTAVTLAELRPGDVIQFRDYRYDREVVTESSDGERIDEDFQERPHHTAVVERVDGNGAITVLEQNAPVGSPVSRAQLFFSSGRRESGRTTTTIRVRGTFWFYRPEAR